MRVSSLNRWVGRCGSEIYTLGATGRLAVVTICVVLTLALRSSVFADSGPSTSATSATTVQGSVNFIDPNGGYPPEIISFSWRNPTSDAFVFYGQVVDQYPSGIMIIFGGILDGNSCYTAQDGTFSFGIILDPTINGIATAQAMNTFGVLSNVAETSVYH